jgi:phage tail sheath protein FI
LSNATQLTTLANGAAKVATKLCPEDGVLIREWRQKEQRTNDTFIAQLCEHASGLVVWIDTKEGWRIWLAGPECERYRNGNPTK